MPVAPLPDINRLRFRCRRGMWEIDFLLQKFTSSDQLKRSNSTNYSTSPTPNS